MDYQEKIRNYQPYNQQEEGDKKQIIEYMSCFEDVLTRKNTICHFTPTGFTINKERNKILMVYHTIYQSWAWTGGHADGETDFLKVAIREVKEETGITSIEPITQEIFSLEILPVWGHIKKGNYVAPHQHINVTYLLEADETEALQIKKDENSGVKWIPLDQIKKYSTETSMYEYYDKIIEKLKRMK